MGRLETFGQAASRNGLAQQSLNGAKGGQVALRNKCNGAAATAGTCCSPYAMHIVFGIAGGIEINDLLDIINVYAATNDVGGYEHGYAACLELLHGLLALGLAEVGVHGQGIEPLLTQLDVELLALEEAKTMTRRGA